MSNNSDQGPRCTVDVLCYRFVEGHLQVLLVKRKFEPFKDHWAIPGGFVESDETIRTAARRELKEETNITPEHLKQFRAYGGPDRDPRGPVVTICYVAFLPSEQTDEQASSDAREVTWHDPHNPPSLAFDHQRILTEANDDLAERARSETTVFRLLPDPFTIKDVHTVYEQILQTSISSTELKKALLNRELISPVTTSQDDRFDQEQFVLNNEKADRYFREKNAFLT